MKMVTYWKARSGKKEQIPVGVTPTKKSYDKFIINPWYYVRLEGRNVSVINSFTRSKVIFHNDKDYITLKMSVYNNLKKVLKRNFEQIEITE